MIEIKHAQQRTRLRRLALSGQGLLQRTPFGSGIAGAREAVNQLGYVQIDTISVVERAHHHVLYSRVPKFNPEMTNQLLLEGAIFEYWAHAASFLPIRDFRFSLPYKQAIKNGRVHWYKNPDKKLMQELLARIKAEGPLRSRDIEAKRTPQAGWGGWKPAKKALEQLYMEGQLMVCDRTGFQKSYDLAERVLGPGVDTRMPSLQEFAEHLVDQGLRCHAVVSLKNLTYLRKNPELREAVQAVVVERVAAGQLEELRLSS